ncbi:acriflavin resistance protein [Salipiger aestuarii]|uniref:Putative spermidine/putrescine transport system permease protein n=1 Tax=Salipiger aestuarii TaxID=568098 RepID=A0A327YT81_9RHOB|nr:ABC transporter permease subunit [Salipiger aestuarii]EIE49148.1 binding-protein-dependent transport systems inner membrane component [Citreicella sp. 357]KAA8609675.1 acriflavin resistance protein [Salipiger aestuarii]KAA8614007.1 acriflavin resistance protein [Salipiger aestuarii]KAB2543697.1 acriflavin resistance protein [Salipiger aestuarii]RAK22935.1 putative spermidine/putrescine transport system permease protein [Salipiger aestuarii]
MTAPPHTPARKPVLPLGWLGLFPFALFALLFLILPTMNIVTGAFQTADGTPTLQNIANLFQPSILSAYWISIRISFATALLGCLIGFGIAAAVTLGNLPGWLRGPVMTFSGVASNFAGVPLSFAFIATLGRVGLVTVLLREWFGLNLYSLGFNLLSFWGLTLVYLFFQIPLMVLIVTPALDGLRREWREASDILGATGGQYWRMVALPILTPTLLGTFALLFANSFGAVATAYALTGSSLSIVPIVLFAQIRGDVLQDPHLGYALAFGMIVVTGIANGLYVWLRAKTERWTV